MSCTMYYLTSPQTLDCACLFLGSMCWMCWGITVGRYTYIFTALQWMMLPGVNNNSLLFTKFSPYSKYAANKEMDQKQNILLIYFSLIPIFSSPPGNTQVQPTLPDFPSPIVGMQNNPTGKQASVNCVTLSCTVPTLILDGCRDHFYRVLLALCCQNLSMIYIYKKLKCTFFFDCEMDIAMCMNK